MLKKALEIVLTVLFALTILLLGFGAMAFLFGLSTIVFGVSVLLATTILVVSHFSVVRSKPKVVEAMREQGVPSRTAKTSPYKPGSAPA